VIILIEKGPEENRGSDAGMVPYRKLVLRPLRGPKRMKKQKKMIQGPRRMGAGCRKLVSSSLRGPTKKEINLREN